MAANNRGRELTKPGSTYLSVHLAAAEVIASGMKALGLMKGDVKEAVAAGVHALFMLGWKMIFWLLKPVAKLMATEFRLLRMKWKI